MARKSDIVTFKVDEQLMELLRHIPNRSNFIRSAVLRALENVCPLCQGAGVLSTSQLKHWEDFSRHHELRECPTCEEFHLVCNGEEDSAHDS